MGTLIAFLIAFATLTFTPSAIGGFAFTVNTNSVVQDDYMGNVVQDDYMGNVVQDDYMGNVVQDDYMGNVVQDDYMGN